MALLEARGLVKIYGKRRVVDGVSFDVNAGEVIGLLGPNGAGKTTSFRMTTGQLAPYDGQVVFNGEDVTRLPMFRRARLGMGYLTQEQSIFRKLTVEKNLVAILEALPRSRSLGRKLSYHERWERTNQLIERFQLTHVRKNPAARCSGGEKRRLEIARCLACEPLLILLDEPFAAVDPKTTEDIRRNIRELAHQGIGILLTDHNVREVLKITDRSYLIKDGKVVTQGTPQQLIHDPIAINEYLGTTFTDNTFGGNPARDGTPAHGVLPPFAEPVPPLMNGKAVADHEQRRRWVEALRAEATRPAAVTELLKGGRSSVPPLVEALGWREPDLRVQAFELLKRIVPAPPLQFDPFAADDVRARQLVTLQQQLGVAR
jgi:lipopolysaccharide export system ATP-binding protein